MAGERCLWYGLAKIKSKRIPPYSDHMGVAKLAFDIPHKNSQRRSESNVLFAGGHPDVHGRNVSTSPTRGGKYQMFTHMCSICPRCEDRLGEVGAVLFGHPLPSFSVFYLYIFLSSTLDSVDARSALHDRVVKSIEF